MVDLRIESYTAADNEAALRLEQQCSQGTSVAVRFRRPTFDARSRVYRKYRILCAKVDGELVGIVAWAEKWVRLRGDSVRAAYLYDLRVHPAYRRQNVARRIVAAMLEDIGEGVDCTYALVAGENEGARALCQRHLGMDFAIPLTYAVLPAYRKQVGAEGYRLAGASEVHRTYLELNGNVDFVPELEEESLLGYVTSVAVGETAGGGCSIWTNEDLLAEEIVAIPRAYSILRVLAAPLRLFWTLPHIPKPPETVRSWFLFDLFARDEQSLRSLLATVNNLALTHHRQFLYIVLPNVDPLLTWIRRARPSTFLLPYLFLARGRVLPAPQDRIYIDVRDV